MISETGTEITASPEEEHLIEGYLSSQPQYNTTTAVVPILPSQENDDDEGVVKTAPLAQVVPVATAPSALVMPVAPSAIEPVPASVPTAASSSDRSSKRKISTANTTRKSMRARKKDSMSKTAIDDECNKEKMEWNAMLYQLVLYKANHDSDPNVTLEQAQSPTYAPLFKWLQEQRKVHKEYMALNACHKKYMTMDSIRGRGANVIGSTSVEASEKVNDPGTADNNINTNRNTPSQSNLITERAKILTTLGVKWFLKGDRHWENNFVLLKGYKEEFGNTLVPRKWDRNKNLGEWVTDQRRQYKFKINDLPSHLTTEREEKLNSIGFTWALRNRVLWDQRYAELVAFHQIHGHTCVPQAYRDNVALGKWVSKQREMYRLYLQHKPSSMKPEKIELLNRIGFVWSAKGRKAHELEYLERKFEENQNHNNVGNAFFCMNASLAPLPITAAGSIPHIEGIEDVGDINM